MAHFMSTFRVRVLLLLMLSVMMFLVYRCWPEKQSRHPEYVEEEPQLQLRHAENSTPVVITVFYETLCPDSKNFIVRQLLPTVQKAAKFVDFVLVPYGKAKTITNPDGSLRFECQHGEHECDGNIYHACVIETVDEPQVLLDSIVCMIRNNQNPKEAMQRCTREHHVDTEQVQKCFDSPHGAELHKQYGEATGALSPPMSFVPTVTLDGAQGRQASILKDLLGEVCKVAGGHAAHPSVCPQ